MNLRTASVWRLNLDLAWEQAYLFAVLVGYDLSLCSTSIRTQHDSISKQAADDCSTGAGGPGHANAFALQKGIAGQRKSSRECVVERKKCDRHLPNLVREIETSRTICGGHDEGTYASRDGTSFDTTRNTRRDRGVGLITSSGSEWRCSTQRHATLPPTLTSTFPHHIPTTRNNSTTMEGWSKLQTSLAGLNIGQSANKFAKGFNSSVQATRERLGQISAEEITELPQGTFISVSRQFCYILMLLAYA